MKKRIIIALCIIFAFIAGVLVGGFLLIEDKQEESIANIDIKYHKGEKYYIIKGDYKGEYDYQELDLGDDSESTEVDMNDKVKLFNTTEVLNYNEYQEFCAKWNLDMKYNEPDKNYMVVAYASHGQPIVKARLANVVEKNNPDYIIMNAGYPLYEGLNGSSTMGEDDVKKFNHDNNIELIARAHQLIQEGYQFMFDDGLVTVWSAPNYCYRCGNDASIMEFDEHMNRAFKIFEACPADVRNQPDKKPAPEYFL